jgi:DNA-binding response OmpR family regulator
MESLGSVEAPVSSRSLEVRITTPRKKISDTVGGGSNPVFGTHGVGYKHLPTLKLK